MTGSKGGRVLMMVRNKFRDLPGASLVKYHLEHRYGHEVKIAIRTDNRFMWSFRPDLITQNNPYGKRWVSFAKFCRRNGAAVALLPEEKVYNTKQLQENFDEYSRFAGYRRTPDPSWIDRYYAHDPEGRDAVIDFGLANADAVELVGLPRQDIYVVPGFREVFTRERLCAKYKLDPSRPVVTLTTTMIDYAHRADQGTPDDYALPAPSADKLKIKKEDEPYRQRIAKDVAARSKCLHLAASIVERYPDINLLVKVHPFEPPEIYHRYFDQDRFPNVRVADRDYAWPVLYGTDLLIHQQSFTALEGWILGKPSVMMPAHGGFSATVIDEELQRLSRDPAAPESFLDQVGYYLDGARVGPDLLARRRALLERRYHGLDGKASERVAKSMDALLRSRPSGVRALRRDLYLRGRHAWVSTKAMMGRLAGRKPKDPYRIHSDWRGVYDVTPADEKEWMDSIAQAYSYRS